MREKPKGISPARISELARECWMVLGRPSSGKVRVVAFRRSLQHAIHDILQHHVSFYSITANPLSLTVTHSHLLAFLFFSSSLREMWKIWIRC